MRVATFNVNGAGSSASEIARLGAMCDVICLQEIKSRHAIELPGFETFWTPATFHAGHHGTAILARATLHPRLLSVQMHDPGDLPDAQRGHFAEGRITAIECDLNPTEKVIILSVYSPNSGVDRTHPLTRLNYRVNHWDPDLGALIGALAPANIILCGDLNVAVREIDVHNPKTLARKAGFTTEERESFKAHVLSRLADTWAELHGDEITGFTFFGPYQKLLNKGWRLDYQLHSSGVVPTAISTLRDFESSDHIPLLAEYKIQTTANPISLNS